MIKLKRLTAHAGTSNNFLLLHCSDMSISCFGVASVCGHDLSCRYLFSISCGIVLEEWRLHDDAISCLWLSQDKERLVTASWDSTVRLYSVVTVGSKHKLLGTVSLQLATKGHNLFPFYVVQPLREFLIYKNDPIKIY